MGVTKNLKALAAGYAASEAPYAKPALELCDVLLRIVGSADTSEAALHELNAACHALEKASRQGQRGDLQRLLSLAGCKRKDLNDLLNRRGVYQPPYAGWNYTAMR